MKKLAALIISFAFLALADSSRGFCDSRGDELAAWLDQRGVDLWGKPPERCDDLTFARRIYLDVLGRVPSVSELRDFQQLGTRRRQVLIEQLVFGEGPRGDTYKRLSAGHLARQWRQVLLPPGTTVTGTPATLETWLEERFRDGVAYDEMMSQLVRIPAATAGGQYYQLVGSLPENYAGHVSRVMLGVRIECAQCHDHPFTDWKQGDFWGLAAFFNGLARNTAAPDASKTVDATSIVYEGETYDAKFLWSDDPIKKQAVTPRGQLSNWMTAADNPNFAATAVNRFWQHLIGHGLYADIENLDLATQKERKFLDELGGKFAEDGFDVRRLIAAICKTHWYQSVSQDSADDAISFHRTLKVISPEQVFDSLEQSLLLPVSRIDPSSSRWTGDRMQLVGRLSESVGATPEDYSSGIPQALLLMNGKMTSDAISMDRSRLLRAVVESPFFSEKDRVKTLYLAVLTREPTADEGDALTKYLQAKSKESESDRDRAYGEILWALLNSPEFVLCR